MPSTTPSGNNSRATTMPAGLSARLVADANNAPPAAEDGITTSVPAGTHTGRSQAGAQDWAGDDDVARTQAQIRPNGVSPTALRSGRVRGYISPEEQELLDTGDDDTLVTVLYGYPNEAKDKVHYVDHIKFVGGVAQNVPFPIAKKLKGMSFGHAIHLVPNDSEEVEYNTAVGMQQMHPGKLAAHLKGADYNALYLSLGADGAMYVIQQLSRCIQEAAKTPNAVQARASAPAAPAVRGGR
jgi:hypothetical protein